MDETEDLLDLAPYFAGRRLVTPHTWAEDVYPAIHDFCASRLRRGRSYNLHLHAHTSIAVAVGYQLDAKASIDAAPIQGSTSGSRLWDPTLPSAHPASAPLMFTEDRLKSDGAEVAVGLSVTNDVRADVGEYAGQALPGVGRIIWAAMTPKPSTTAVVDGAHAQALAEQLREYLRSNRAADERRAVLHLFIAAPNGLAYFLGQLLRGLGPCILYEYDLEGNTPGGYAPSLAFPPPAPSAGTATQSAREKE